MTAHNSNTLGQRHLITDLTDDVQYLRTAEDRDDSVVHQDGEMESENGDLQDVKSIKMGRDHGSQTIYKRPLEIYKKA